MKENYTNIEQILENPGIYIFKYYKLLNGAKL